MLFKTNSIFLFFFFLSSLDICRCALSPLWKGTKGSLFRGRCGDCLSRWGLQWAWASAFLTWQSLVKPKLIFKCELVNGKVQRRPRGAASENSCVSSHPRPGAVPLVGHLCLDAPENIMLETEVSISGLKETVKTFVSQGSDTTTFKTLVTVTAVTS